MQHVRRRRRLFSAGACAVQADMSSAQQVDPSVIATGPLSVYSTKVRGGGGGAQNRFFCPGFYKKIFFWQFLSDSLPSCLNSLLFPSVMPF